MTTRRESTATVGSPRSRIARAATAAEILSPCARKWSRLAAGTDFNTATAAAIRRSSSKLPAISPQTDVASRPKNSSRTRLVSRSSFSRVSRAAAPSPATARPRASSRTSVVSPIAETTTRGRWPAARATIFASLSRAGASSTEVPPNFWTITGRSPDKSAESVESVEEPFDSRVLGVEDGGPRGAADRVVAEHRELPVEDSAGLEAPHEGRHPPLRVHVAPGLRPLRLGQVVDRPLGGGRQAGDLGVPAELPPRFLEVFGPWLLRQRDRNGFRVAVLDRDAVGHRGDGEVRRDDAIPLGAAEDLDDLALQLFSLFRDVGDDVAEDVERGHAGITRAGDRLHRRDEALL